MTDLIFLDCETTGLDSDKHEIWEIAWAVGEGKIETAVVHHDLRTADPEALAMNGYHVRCAGLTLGNHYQTELRLKEILKGATLVGANIAFDARFLKARWKAEPWHYRTIDIESMALAILGYERPKGLKAIWDDLDALGYILTEPDHSAGHDVATTRDVYHALRAHQHRLIRTSTIVKEQNHAHEESSGTAS